MGRHNTSILLDSLFACSSYVVNVMVFCCRLYSTKSVSKLNFIPNKDVEEKEPKDRFLELSELKAFLSISKEYGLSFDYLAFAT
ncbi:hypothetical protein N9I19_18985 [Peribacillus sp. CSMR9]|nr:hypothetical protein [Peribacillus sp. CSMR9]